LTPERTKTNVPAGASRLAVEFEGGAALHDEVQLLVGVRLCLVVLVDDPVARFAARPGVDAEGGDAEVMAHRPEGTPAVVHLLDLVSCAIA
jgi:hypothetical protein